MKVKAASMGEGRKLHLQMEWASPALSLTVLFLQAYPLSGQLPCPESPCWSRLCGLSIRD